MEDAPCRWVARSHDWDPRLRRDVGHVRGRCRGLGHIGSECSWSMCNGFKKIEAFILQAGVLGYVLSSLPLLESSFFNQRYHSSVTSCLR
jgi:hypothetical protein